MSRIINLQGISNRCLELLQEIVPTANWSAVEDQHLWLIEQLGIALSGSINLEVIDQYVSSNNMEGFREWYVRINEIAQEYAEMRAQYEKYIHTIYCPFSDNKEE